MKDGYSLELIPDRLRGDIASFDLKDKKGKTIVEAGRRITARHVRLLEEAGIKRLDVPSEYLVGQDARQDIVDTETGGEVLAECNAEVTEEFSIRSLPLTSR